MTIKVNDKRPALYRRTACNIWTDPHIRKQMLAEHLNPGSDGASRRPESIRRTIDLIAANTPPGGTLLDLGCGPGLYTSLLKDKGYKVTGIDFNTASIDYARSRREDIDYIAGDYIADYPQGRFDTVIMIYCDMGTHTENDRVELLRNIHDSLTKGGRLIFDVFTPELTKERRESKNWEYSAAGGFWSEREYLLLEQTFHYPRHNVFAHQYNLISGGQLKHFIVWERYFTEEQITAMLINAGFGEVTFHRSIAVDNNFTSDAALFVVAQK